MKCMVKPHENPKIAGIKTKIAEIFFITGTITDNYIGHHLYTGLRLSNTEKIMHQNIHCIKDQKKVLWNELFLKAWTGECLIEGVCI